VDPAELVASPDKPRRVALDSGRHGGAAWRLLWRELRFAAMESRLVAARVSFYANYAIGRGNRPSYATAELLFRIAGQKHRTLNPQA
jgi:hypothetical protein